MKKEISIGILALLATAVLIFGFKFLKGKDVFNRNQKFFIEYMNVNALTISTPVMVNGFQVGIVSNISLKPEDMRTVIVEIEVKKEVKIPKTTIAQISDVGFLGNKIINLLYNGSCKEGNCAVSGDYLSGKSIGLLSSMIGKPDEFGQYLTSIENGVTGILDTVNDYFKDGDQTRGLSLALNNLQKTISNLSLISKELNNLLITTNKSLPATFQNLKLISDNLNQNSENISGILSNFNGISSQVKNAEIDKVFKSAQNTFDGASNRLNDLELAINNINSTVGSLSNMLNGIQSGKGTLGKIIADDDLYTNIEALTKHLDLLLQDLRLNPKRYVNVSLFGKKQKEYQLPDDDPAQPLLIELKQDSIQHH